MKPFARTFILLFVLCTLAIVTIFSFPACSKKQSESKVIKIGWIGPLTGDLGYYGQMVKKGTDLALDEINKEGGINGAKLKVLYHDDTLNPQKGVAAFLKLVQTDNVPLIIQAAGSSIMLAEAPLAEKYKIVLISPTCSNPKIKYAGDYVFRTYPSDDYQGTILAQFVHNTLKKNNAAVLYLNNDYGIGVKDVFVKSFESLGGIVSVSEGFDESASDFRSQLTKIKSSGSQVIFLSSHYKEGALVVKQAKELGINLQIVTSDACYAPEFIRLSGNASEGNIVANLHWDVDSNETSVRRFVTKFTDTYGQQPEVYAATAYDCMNVVAKSMLKGGVKSEGIKRALYATERYEGVTGNISFDEYGEVKGEYDFFIVRNERFVLYENNR